MDLGNLKTKNEPVKMFLRHPGDGTQLKDDNGEPVYLLVIGQDHDEYRKARLASTDQRLKQGMGKGGRIKATAAQLEEDGAELLVRCVKSWSGIVLGGEALSCTEDNVRRLFKECPWVQEQVDEFVDDRGNFLGN